MDALEVASCCSQIACGFYYKWHFPKEDQHHLVADWYAARKAWAQEVRGELKRRKEGLDTEGLLRNAAERFYGIGKNAWGVGPKWKSETFRAWFAIEKAVEHVTRAHWIDDYLVRSAAAWAKTNNGIIWYQYGAFGHRLAQMTGLPRYGQKAAKVYNLNATPEMDRSRQARESLGTWKGTPSDWIQVEPGTRPIIASIESMGTSKNLQAFSRQLWANQASDGARWEQGIGRSYRFGQPEDTVRISVYRHLEEFREQFRKAIGFAEWMGGITRNPQSLLNGLKSWTSADPSTTPPYVANCGPT